MVVPASPVVPCDEDGGARPEPALDQRVHLIHRPLHSHGDVARYVAPVWRMLIVLSGAVDEGDVRERRGCRIQMELVGLLLPTRVDPIHVIDRVTTVALPGEARLFET